MENKKSFIFAGLEAIHALCLILIVKVIAPVCTGMVETAAGKQIPMKCHYTSVVLLFLGVLLLVNAILCVVKKDMIVCGGMMIAISILVFLVLNPSIGIGICLNPEMACNLTASFVKILGGIGVVIGGLSVYFGVRQTK